MGDALLIRTQVAIALKEDPWLWPDPDDAKRYIRYVRDWLSRASTQVYAGLVPFPITDDLDALRQSIDTMLTFAANSPQHRMITVPDFTILAAKAKNHRLLSRSGWMMSESKEWGKHSTLMWTRESIALREAAEANTLNRPPQVFKRELLNWTRKHAILLKIASTDFDRYGYASRDKQMHITGKVDWRAAAKRHGYDSLKDLNFEELVRQAKSAQFDYDALSQAQEEVFKSQGQRDIYLDFIDVDWIAANGGWTDLPSQFITISGDPDKGVPRTTQEAMAESATKMKELLANAKTENNFTPAPPPADLIPVQFPIYDRAQKGFRILNRVWTAGQRLAFIKHVLDGMSGVPIYAQELDVLSASGSPIPDNAVLVEWDVAWRCPLTGIFHDPRDEFFISDMDGCMSNYAANGQHVADNSDETDTWFMAHQPWYLLSPGNIGDNRYWTQVGPPTQLAVYKRRTNR